VNELGYLEDEVCGRDGCEELISLKEVDGGCSCHISPPCSYCTTLREHCAECGWDAEEEQEAEQLQVQLARQARSEEEKQAERRYWELVKIRNLPRTFDPKRINAEKFSHTNSSMIVEGWFPAGMTMEEVRKEVNGTFGGRFGSFDQTKQTFSFIAYTD